MTNKESFYISSGEKNMMYTLRHQFQEEIWVRTPQGDAKLSVHRDHYICNLSTDKDRAMAKVKELGYTVRRPEFTLDEIRALEEERLSNHALAIRTESFRQAVRGLKATYSRMSERVSSGCMPYGLWMDEQIADVPVDYLCWMYNKLTKKIEELNPNQENPTPLDTLDGQKNYFDYMLSVSLIGAVKHYAKIDLDEFIEKKKGTGNYFGDVKKRYKKQTLTLLEAFSYDAFYGRTYIRKFAHKETGDLLVYKGSTGMGVGSGDCGGEFLVDFTVKEHTVYDDVIQTTINRPKVIQE